MNVLFLEDRGATAFFVERWLKENGHNVLSAFNPNDAQDHWNKRDKVPIHCIILDLRTPTEGLDEKQKKRSAGGFLTGWIWLFDNVLTEARKCDKELSSTPTTPMSSTKTTTHQRKIMRALR